VNPLDSVIFGGLTACCHEIPWARAIKYVYNILRGVPYSTAVEEMIAAGGKTPLVGSYT